MKNTFYRETNQCFSAFYAQHAKMNGKQSILEHRTKLPKTCLLSNFELYRQKNDKKQNKNKPCKIPDVVKETVIAIIMYYEFY